jgi:hypothetical protein
VWWCVIGAFLGFVLCFPLKSGLVFVLMLALHVYVSWSFFFFMEPRASCHLPFLVPLLGLSHDHGAGLFHVFFLSLSSLDSRPSILCGCHKLFVLLSLYETSCKYVYWQPDLSPLQPLNCSPPLPITVYSVTKSVFTPFLRHERVSVCQNCSLTEHKKLLLLSGRICYDW